MVICLAETLWEVHPPSDHRAAQNCREQMLGEGGV
jgi:hypothetical protein